MRGRLGTRAHCTPRGGLDTEPLCLLDRHCTLPSPDSLSGLGPPLPHTLGCWCGALLVNPTHLRPRRGTGHTAGGQAGCPGAAWATELPPASAPSTGGVWVEARDTRRSAHTGRELVPHHERGPVFLDRPRAGACGGWGCPAARACGPPSPLLALFLPDVIRQSAPPPDPAKGSSSGISHRPDHGDRQDLLTCAPEWPESPCQWFWSTVGLAVTGSTHVGELLSCASGIQGQERRSAVGSLTEVGQCACAGSGP